VVRPSSDATFIIGLSYIGVIYSHLLDLVLCEYVLQHDTTVFLDLQNLYRDILGFTSLPI